MKNIVKYIIPLSIRFFLKSYYFKIKRYWDFITSKIRTDSFKFCDKQYKYFVALYNSTFLNERAVEIPIIMDYINTFRDRSVLEIGNVIGHYFNLNHDVVDKYEKIENVINCDILDYFPDKKYDLIVSISTFEHIGFDEVTRYGETSSSNTHRENLPKAIEHTKSLLKSNGIFIFTVPLGFNTYLDSMITDNALNLTSLVFLRRISSNNVWKEVKYEDIKNIEYGKPYICANGLLIGIYNKQL